MRLVAFVMRTYALNMRSSRSSSCHLLIWNKKSLFFGVELFAVGLAVLIDIGFELLRLLFIKILVANHELVLIFFVLNLLDFVNFRVGFLHHACLY